MDQALKNKLTNLSPQQLKELMKKMGKERKELPLIPRNELQQYPVTGAQKRMWFLSKLDPDSYLYTNPIGIRIKSKGSLDIDLYVHGFRKVVQRHEIMRTSFFSREGQIMQQIHPDVSFSIEKIDLQTFPETEKQAAVDEILATDGKTPIRIEDFPLFKFKLLVLSSQEFVLLYTSHHIISDAWSSSAIFREMQEIYEQTLAGKQEETAHFKYQFVDYVYWEQTWSESEEYRQALSKWKSLLPAVPEPLNLPLDFVRPAVIHYEGGLEKTKLQSDFVHRLHEFSRKEGVNLFHTLLAGFNVLLHYYSRNDEIVVGIPLANRKLKEFQRTVGMFLNTLPHRTVMDPSTSFRTYLQQVKSISQEMVIHQDFPFEKLVEELNPPRDLSIAPIFQVLFVFQNIPDMYQWDDLDVSPIKPDYHISKYELNLWIEEVAGGLFLSMTYQTRLFKKESIALFLNYYTEMLATLIDDPELSISDLRPQKQEIRGPLSTWSPPTDPYIRAFEKHASVRGDALALAYDTTSFSYRQLNEKANQLAHYLRQFNKTKPLIAFLLPRSAEQIISILAIHKVGGAYLPIDPAITEERLHMLLNDAGVDLLITQSAYHSLFKNTSVKWVLLDDERQEIEHCRSDDPGIVLQPQDLAYVLYTSGTTGISKGVCIEHAQLSNYAQSIWKRMGLPSDSRFATVSGITTDLGNTQIFPALMHGAAVDMVPDAYITNPALLANYTHEHAIDCLKIVPSLLTSLLRTPNAAAVLPLKLLILGGEKTTASMVNEIRKHRPGLRIINHYGPTETTIGILTHEIGAVQPESMIPLGVPLDNNNVFIMDTKGRVIPNGMPGEIVISGLNVGRGYHQNEKLTQTVFSADSEHTMLRTYRTGDLGRKNTDGTISFLGRIDRQVKIRGFRVEPEAIERTILRHQDITQAVVLEQEGRLLAYVVLAEFAKLGIPQLKHQLRNGLPAYMVPDEITALPQLPRLSNGKINIRALRAYNAVSSDTIMKAIAPRNEVELAISRLWKDLLKVNSISVTDNFFEVGGTSLAAIEFVAKLNQLFDTELGIGILFEYNTIQSLAVLVKSCNHTSDNSSMVLLKKGTSDHYLFFVHPAGGDVFSYYELASKIDPAFHVYGLQSMDFNLPDHSIHALAERYLDAIRTEIPVGVYVFGGWSMGAYVAYEMAQQWQTLTHEAVPVILLDQRAPGRAEANSAEKISVLERQVAFARKIEHLTGKKNNLTNHLLEPLSITERTGLFLEAFKESHLVPDELETHQFQGFLDKMMEHHDITARYRAHHYEGSVLLIKAADSTAFEESNPAYAECYGWSGLVSEHLRTETVPGNHVSIMRSPYAQTVAIRINETLMKGKTAVLTYAPV